MKGGVVERYELPIVDKLLDDAWMILDIADYIDDKSEYRIQNVLHELTKVKMELKENMEEGYHE